MITAWRITKDANPSSAFSGVGARLYGGRWNSKGTTVVYTAATQSLAMLEILVHLKNARQVTPPVPYTLFQVTFEEPLVDELPLPHLPVGWDAEPPLAVSKSIGDNWVSAATKPVLAVPSAIIPSERNYLLNPAHKDFSRIALGPPQPCRFDPRLL